MSAQKDGRLFFADRNGFTTFVPTAPQENIIHSPVIVSDILLGNTSFRDLDASERKRIASQTPNFTREITIPNDYNNFTLKFAILTYELSQLCHYAYLLEGFDQDWKYTDGTHQSAYYSNLKPVT